MRRRELLKRAGAAIVPAVILGSHFPALVSSWERGTSRITAVVYDERYSDCQLFADIAVGHGATAFPVNGDCARLWFGTLRDHVVRRGGCVAGLTTDSDFVVSRMCGRELGLGVAYEGGHDGRGSISISHCLRSSGRERNFANVLRSDDARWAGNLGVAMNLVCSHDAGDTDAVQTTVLLKTPRASDYPGYLTSWLLQKTV